MFNVKRNTPSRHCLQRLRQHFSRLSATQQRVAEFVLQHPNEALAMSIHDIAARCGVSSSTVVRLAKDIGFAGFKEMKVQLAMEVGSLLVSQDLTDQQHDLGNATALFENTVRGLEETLAGIDQEAVDAAVEAIAGANKIDVYGASTSFLVGLDLIEKLKRLGLYASGHSNAYMQAISAMSLGPNDVALAMTYSGETADVIDALAVAREQGATTIALTNFADSTVVQWSDIVVSTSVSRNLLPDGSMSGRIAQLFLVDLIFTRLFAREPERFAAAFRKYNQILLSKVSKSADPTEHVGGGFADVDNDPSELELGILSLAGSEE